MTARQVWEGMLTELSKVNAPSMLLQDFNYFFNKAINQYINKRYNIYDINQQTTDDLRVLKATSILDVHPATDSQPLASLVGYGAGKSKLLDATYEVYLPQDYLHILNCVCIYKVNKRYKCYNQGDYVQFSAKRLNGDSWSVILNDYYNRPLPERPYYYIHNINTNIENNLTPTNPSIFESQEEATYRATISINDIRYTATSKTEEDAKNAVKGKLPDDINIDDKFIRIEKIYENGKILKSGTDLNATSYEIPVWLATGIGSNKQGLKAYSDSESGARSLLEELNNNEEPGNVKVQQILTSVNGNSNFPRQIQLNLLNEKGESYQVFTDAVEKSSAQRYGNATTVRMEIRYGHDRSLFELEKVFVDYIKTPQFIRLTQEQVNLTEDTSQIMEFPDYVCQEIINELTNLVMENTADPRLQTHPVITQSIANPAQQQEPTPQQRRQQQ